jgi:hypothetical protein
VIKIKIGMTFHGCTAMTQTGTPCQNPPLSGLPFCGRHNSARANKEKQNMASLLQDLTLLSLELNHVLSATALPPIEHPGQERRTIMEQRVQQREHDRMTRAEQKEIRKLATKERQKQKRKEAYQAKKGLIGPKK